jgi:hypothetical protein
MSKPKDREPIDAADRIRKERPEYRQIEWISQNHTFTNDFVRYIQNNTSEMIANATEA